MGTADKMYFKSLISENDLDEPKWGLDAVKILFQLKSCPTLPIKFPKMRTMAKKKMTKISKKPVTIRQDMIDRIRTLPMSAKTSQWPPSRKMKRPTIKLRRRRGPNLTAYRCTFEFLNINNNLFLIIWVRKSCSFSNIAI